MIKRLLPVLCAALISAPAAALAGPEVHAIGIYETREWRSGQRTAREVPVIVDREGAEVTLLLGAYEPVRWLVTTTEGTELVRVIVHGNGAAKSQLFVNDALFENVEMSDLPWSYSDSGIRFRALVRALHGPQGPGRLDLFLGAYRAPDEGFVIDRAEPGNPAYSDDPAKRLITRPEAVTPALAEAFGWRGPDPLKRVRFTYDGFEVLADDGGWTSHPVTLDVPEISWPVDAAMDVEGNLYGVSLGGEGFLYRFSPATGGWAVLRSMDNVDASGMMYDAGRHRLIIGGSTLREGPAILIHDLGTGGLTRTVFPKDALAELRDLADPGSSFRPALVPVAVDGGTLLLWSRGDMHGHRAPGGWRSYVVDLATGSATLVDYEEPAD